MELQQIRYFLALSEDLNFSRAAERCGVSQPTLTRAIKKLERDLGGPLVRRERARTHLTELGFKIKPRLEQALILTEQVKTEADDFSQMNSPTLTIGVMSTVGPDCVMAIVRRLGEEFPEVMLKMRTAGGEEIIEWLLGGEIDVGLLGMPSYPDVISIHDLYEERYMVAVPPNHALLSLDAIPAQALEGEKYLKRLNCETMMSLHTSPCEAGLGELSRLKRSMNSMVVVHESEDENLIRQMVIDGMGCAIVPEFMASDTNCPLRPLVDPALSRTVGVATVRGRPHTPVVNLFARVSQKIKVESFGTQ